MSKIALKGNDSGTATFTIESPATSTNRTLTLRDEAGDLVTTATDIEPQVKTATNATGSAPIYACRAWVNFDGTGTVSIRDSGNVSSITDNGTGEYTVNFTTAMPDANYAATFGGRWESGAVNLTPQGLIAETPSATRTTTALSISSRRKDDQTTIDNDLICATIFR